MVCWELLIFPHLAAIFILFDELLIGRLLNFEDLSGRVDLFLRVLEVIVD